MLKPISFLSNTSLNLNFRVQHSTNLQFKSSLQSDSFSPNFGTAFVRELEKADKTLMLEEKAAGLITASLFNPGNALRAVKEFLTRGGNPEDLCVLAASQKIDPAKLARRFSSIGSGLPGRSQAAEAFHIAAQDERKAADTGKPIDARLWEKLGILD